METRHIHTKTRRRWPLEFFIFGLFCLAVFLFFIIIGAPLLLDFIIGLLAGLCFTAAWYEWKWRPIQEVREVVEWRRTPAPEEKAPVAVQALADSGLAAGVPETPPVREEPVSVLASNTEQEEMPTTVFAVAESPLSVQEPSAVQEEMPTFVSSAPLALEQDSLQTEEAYDEVSAITMISSSTQEKLPPSVSPVQPALEQDSLPTGQANNGISAISEQEEMPTLVSSVQPALEQNSLQTEQAADEISASAQEEMPTLVSPVQPALEQDSLPTEEAHDEVEALAASSSSGPNIPTVEAYCVKCRTKRVMVAPERILMKSGHHALKGTCPVCKRGMFRITKENKSATV